MCLFLRATIHIYTKSALEIILSKSFSDLSPRSVFIIMFFCVQRVPKSPVWLIEDAVYQETPP